SLCVAALRAQVIEQNCDYEGNQIINLQGNNVDAGLIVNGSFWWDGQSGAYFVPANSDVTALFAGSLWLGAFDEGQNLRTAAQTYGASPNFPGTDFFPGPIDAQTGLTNQQMCEDYNRFWEVRRTEIDAAILDFEDNGLIDGVLHVNILGWPGRNNPYFDELFGFSLPLDQEMAPFFDRDEDQIYDPTKGDYPLIKGADQAIWWVFNDMGNEHLGTPGSVPLGAEVQALAYSYNSTVAAINDATYYDLKIINRGEDWNDLRAGIWLDPDLGCFVDDYLGCSPEDDLAFFYNSDAIDGIGSTCDCAGTPSYCDEIPMVGVKILKGLPDENGNDQGMSAFTYYNNGGANPPPTPGTTDPIDPLDYFLMLEGRWIDGSLPIDPTTGIPSQFAFSGDPSDATTWSMCSQSVLDGDRRVVISSGPSEVDEGTNVELSFAIIWVPDVPHPCPSLAPLLEACQQVEGAVITSTNEALEEPAWFQLLPNPMTADQSVLQMDPRFEIDALQLYQVDGQLLRTYQNVGSELIIERKNLPPGVYFFRAQTSQNEAVLTGKLLIQ
ncbi:MAG: T9SS type A sorting domain-containing protein, partial [Bacteroidota bacterium]